MNRLIRNAVVAALIAMVAGLASLSLTTPAHAQAGSCSDAGAETVADLIANASSAAGFDSTGTDYDVLSTALVAAGLNTVLDVGAASYTAFVPNDAAFIAFANDLGFAGSDEAGASAAIVTALLADSDPAATFGSLLRYHLLGTVESSADIAAASSLTTILGSAITVSGTHLVDLSPATGNASIVQADIAACNGVVHVIDQVMLPLALSAADQTPTPDPTAIPGPTATAVPNLTIHGDIIIDGPERISSAPASPAGGLYGFGINAVAADTDDTSGDSASDDADDTDTDTDAGDTDDSSVGGGIGGGDASVALAATGSRSEAALAIAVGLFAVGASFVVSSRRTIR